MIIRTDVNFCCGHLVEVIVFVCRSSQKLEMRKGSETESAEERDGKLPGFHAHSICGKFPQVTSSSPLTNCFEVCLCFEARTRACRVMSQAGPANISQGSILELRTITAEHVDRFAKEGRSAVKGQSRRIAQLEKVCLPVHPTFVRV